MENCKHNEGYLRCRVQSIHLVVVQQLGNVPVHVDAGVVAVEAELVALLLDPGVEAAAVAAEADAEEVLVLGRVPQQEAPLRLVLQQRLSLVSTQ